MAELRQITPREYSSLTPGSKFPLTGPGVRDNGSIWFRGLFGALGAALAACGKSGTQISHLKVNHDDLFEATPPKLEDFDGRSVTASELKQERVETALDNLYKSKELPALERLVRLLILRLSALPPDEFPREDAEDEEGILPHRSSALLRRAWLSVCDGSAIGEMEGLDKLSTAALGVRQARITALKSARDTFDQQIQAICSACVVRDGLYTRTLSKQLGVAGRRVRELLFETLGETQKALHRSAYLASQFGALDTQAATRVLGSLQWCRFLNKVESDWNAAAKQSSGEAVFLTNIRPPLLQTVFKDVATAVVTKVASTGWVFPGPKLPGIEILHVAAIHTHSLTPAPSPAPGPVRKKPGPTHTATAGSSDTFTLASSAEALQTGLSSYLGEVSRGRKGTSPSPADAVKALPLYPATLTLSAHSVAWMGSDMFHECAALRGRVPSLTDEGTQGVRFVGADGSCRVPCAFSDAHTQHVEGGVDAPGPALADAGADPSVSLLGHFEAFLATLRVYYCVEERQVRYDQPPPTRPEWMRESVAPTLSFTHKADASLSGSASAVCKYLMTVYPKTYNRPGTKAMFQVGDPRAPSEELRPDGPGFPQRVFTEGIAVVRRERRHRRGTTQEKALVARVKRMAKLRQVWKDEDEDEEGEGEGDGDGSKAAAPPRRSGDVRGDISSDSGSEEDTAKVKPKPRPPAPAAPEDPEVEELWGNDPDRGVVDGADFAGELPEVLVGSVPVPLNPHYTDVVEFHFAPASVHQLLETSMFKRISDAAGSTSPEATALAARIGITQKDVEALAANYHPIHTKPGIIDNLWVVVPATLDDPANAEASRKPDSSIGSSFNSRFLRPTLQALSGPALLHLFSTYLIRGLGAALTANPERLRAVPVPPPVVDPTPEPSRAASPASRSSPQQPQLTAAQKAALIVPRTTKATEHALRCMFTPPECQYVYLLLHGVGQGSAGSVGVPQSIAPARPRRTSYPGDTLVASAKGTPVPPSPEPGAAPLAFCGVLVQARVLTEAQAVASLRDPTCCIGTSGRNPFVVRWAPKSDDIPRDMLPGDAADDDPSALGPFCQWRSCLAPCISARTPVDPSPRASLAGGLKRRPDPAEPAAATATAFCETHLKLKRLLEFGDGGKPAEGEGAAVEVSRYLPRRWITGAVSPKPSKGLAFGGIPSSSWLLHELTTKKLKATLRAFYKRVAENTKAKDSKPAVIIDKEAAAARARADVVAAGLPNALKDVHSLENPLSSVEVVEKKTIGLELTIGSASTTKRLKELRQSASMAQFEIDVARRIRTVEGAVVKELQRLNGLGVYPFDELAAIRFEFEVLDKKRRELMQERTPGQTESKTPQQLQKDDALKRQEIELELVFSERKYLILRSKREAVEAEYGVPHAAMNDEVRTLGGPAGQAEDRPASRKSSSASTARRPPSASAISPVARGTATSSGPSSVSSSRSRTKKTLYS